MFLSWDWYVALRATVCSRSEHLSIITGSSFNRGFWCFWAEIYKMGSTGLYVCMLKLVERKLFSSIQEWLFRKGYIWYGIKGGIIDQRLEDNMQTHGKTCIHSGRSSIGMRRPCLKPFRKCCQKTYQIPLIPYQKLFKRWISGDWSSFITWEASM